MQSVLTLKREYTSAVKIIEMFLENAKLASVHGEPNVVTIVHLVNMDLDVVKGAIVVIGRYAIPNKDVSSHSRVNK